MSTKFRIYGCGGAGLNIVSQLASGSKISLDNKTNIQYSYIDTSKSNIKNGISEDDIYLLEDMDGSGKIREENHKEIGNVIKDILVKHKPEDFNAVVFSLSGGSGSVIGPLLISEMLSRGISVLAVCVGTDESVLTANNTLKSLKSLDAIAKKNNKALIMIYQHNDRGVPRGNIDNKIIGYLGGLAYLFSGNNEELDSQDLINWIDFTRTTSLGPQVGVLEVYSNSADVESKHPNPVSVASLYSDKDVIGVNVVPEYHCAGYTQLDHLSVDQLQFVIDVKDVPVIAKRINETLNQQKEVANSRPQQGSLVSNNDNVEDSGLVL